MTTTTALIIGLVIIGETVFVAVIALAMVRFTLGPIAERFPQEPVEEGAVRKDFQSFRFGMINMGFSVHVAVDASHLHLMPARLFRWFGAKNASVPWEQVNVLGAPGRRYRKAKIGSEEITCPSWCLELAEVSETE